MSTDRTFFTNEEGRRLKDRFDVLIKDAKFFDVLVGYFYASGFHLIYKSLENSEKIRILVGISMDREAYNLSHAETKDFIENRIQNEFEESGDSEEILKGTQIFMDWIQSGKLEIRAYSSGRIHAKVYIISYSEGERDAGRVITGSSNFTRSGISDNLEFNVELKNPADHEFAKLKFEQLWKDSVEISEKYVQTLRKKTWLNSDITPRQMFLKLLYEYFKDELSQTEEIFAKYYPQNFMKLEYQEQAVLNAKKILEEYGGVFISDVVGLGKTYIATMLASQLEGRTLVIAPPHLLNKDNPGSWPNAFLDFKVPASFESIGKLDEIAKKGTDKFKNIIIDEAHRFRSEYTIGYEKLMEICRGKRVILVTATPYNNSPRDILAQIKLFQNTKKSTVPNMPDLESFFIGLSKKLKNLDRGKDYEEYVKIVKENARKIREKALKYLMVRRTRDEIVKYFKKDLESKKLKFPEIASPKPLFYELNENEDQIFNNTIELISQKFTYARYMPLLYLKEKLKDQLELQSQKNMGSFMKILLVKRLESSFFAFNNSVERFIKSYEMFIGEVKKGNVWISKKHSKKIFELIENDDDEKIQKLIDEEKAQKYPAEDFSENFLEDLKSDLSVLKKIKKIWENIERDPKLLSFFSALKKNEFLKNKNIIVFTESRETAEYLAENINRKKLGPALCFFGSSVESVRDKVIENFDAKAKHKKDDFRILVSTEVLSEGVNLHRSNVVINYDIPWNPTRMMQRVGRINRVDTSFDTIYTFNFFPTKQSNDQIKLKEAAEAKINAFFTLLGADSALLTEGEPLGSHELFNKLVSKKTLTGDEGDTSELKYLSIIKDVRDKNPDLFRVIKELPKKARTAIPGAEKRDRLLTYFRLGKLQKFFISNSESSTIELDFIEAAELAECTDDIRKGKIKHDYFSLLEKNKEAFISSTDQEAMNFSYRPGKDPAKDILKIIKALSGKTNSFTDEQEDYLSLVREKIEEGALPKGTIKRINKELKDLGEDLENPFKVLTVLQKSISRNLLERHYIEQFSNYSSKREVILSIYYNQLL